MSGTHGVFQHVSGYFYTVLEEDFCEVYKADGKNEVCRAYITSILEHLTNKQYEATGSDTDIWVFMSLPEMARRMRHAFGERTIHKEIQGMIADGYLFKRRAYGKATMEYRLNIRKLRKALEALPEKQPCNNATYHLANLQDQSGNNARSTLQNYKKDLAELQPRITIEDTLEVPENKERESVSANASTPHASDNLSEKDGSEETTQASRVIAPALTLPSKQTPSQARAGEHGRNDGAATGSSGGEPRASGKQDKPKRGGKEAGATQPPEKTPEELEFDARCSRLYDQFIEWRGYAWNTAGACINERKHIRLLAAKYTDAQIEQFYSHLFNVDFKYSKPSFKYKIGAYDVWHEAPSIEQQLKAGPLPTGNTAEPPVTIRTNVRKFNGIATHD
jgi:hypothetical protein